MRTSLPRLLFVVAVAVLEWSGGWHARDAGQTYAQTAPAAGTTLVRDQWRTIYVGGVQAGYMQDAFNSRFDNGRKVIVNENVVVMTGGLPTAPGATTTLESTGARIITSTTETETGDILGFRYEVQNPPAAPTLKAGQVANGTMRIETLINAVPSVSEVPWQNTVKGPAYADQTLRQNPLKPGETRVITTIDPRSAAVDTVQLQAGALENVPLLGGVEKQLLHVVSTHSIAPGIAFHEYMDTAGESWKTVVPASNMVIYTVSKATALGAVPGALKP